MGVLGMKLEDEHGDDAVVGIQSVPADEVQRKEVLIATKKVRRDGRGGEGNECARLIDLSLACVRAFVRSF